MMSEAKNESPIRTDQVQDLIDRHGGDRGLWGSHAVYSKDDWRYEIENGDTVLGYWEWVYCRIEESGAEDSSDPT